MNFTKKDYQEILDPRGYLPESPTTADIRIWKNYLRRALFAEANGCSQLSGLSVGATGFHIHEGLFPRNVVPKSVRWHWYLFAGPNSFLLAPDEHIPQPPSRHKCYEIACERYGQKMVNRWVESLPFKSQPDLPWSCYD